MAPIAQKCRHIPFALREKVTAIVENVIAKDIVERVDGPTSRVSTVVVAPKISGDIRRCVDTRKANDAVIRERKPMSNADDVLKNLNESTYYDLRRRFHQIEIDEEPRVIITFATHDGLIRYRRLSFGVSSAPEKFLRH